MQAIHINFKALILLTLFPLLLSACSQVKWVEGTHYKRIAESSAETQNLKEYFSFWCPHCFQFEPLIEEVTNKLNVGTRFEKVHVNYMGFLPKEAQDAGTISLMAARVNGSEKAFVEALFAAIHLEKKTLTTLAQIAPIFNATSTNNVNFLTLTQSDEVKNLVHANNQLVDSQGRSLSGVPGLVVNDQYLVILDSGLKSVDEVIELINWLATQ